MKRILCTLVAIAALAPISWAEGAVHPLSVAVDAAATSFTSAASYAGYLPQFSAGADVYITKTFLLRPMVTATYSSDGQESLVGSAAFYHTSDSLGVGAGLDAIFVFPVDSRLSFYAGAGYELLDFNSSSYSSTNGALSGQASELMHFIPVILGGKYFIAEKVGLYFEAGIAAVIDVRSTTSYNTTSGARTGSDLTTYYELDFRPATFGAVILLN
jgi:hypothetical protein